ncbi:MAG TPA: hypothetical protein VLY86_04775 [Methanothrix sp.]|nr:hypothetical protein [Methanothrix sp.]
MNSENIEEMGRLMLGYLPAIYKMDADSEAFLEKFLGIFGSEIIKMEETIADIPRYFDPEGLTDEEEDFLSWLTGWLSLDLFSQYSSLDRDYLLNACQFYRTKGTEAGLIALLEFFSDGKAYIRDGSNFIFRTFCSDLYDDYHTVSLTLNTADTNLLHEMGKYDDQVHRIYSDEDTYVIDAYLVALQASDPDIGTQEEVLEKLADPFVPAIWSVEIHAAG